MTQLKSFIIRKKRIFIGFILLLILYLGFVRIFLPDPLFNTPVSLVAVDKNEQLLGAYIAADGQWRFPYQLEVPEKFREASLCFEDKRFYLHFGIDPIATFRAIYQNIRSMKRVSGGSTITMQLVRMARNKERNIFQKSIEMLLAVYVDLVYSKEEIFALYAWQAPFGGNVVGLEAASWRYFGRSSENLSWAEAATLAVLPNSPALIHPGKNRQALQRKRDFLLDKLRDQGTIDSISCQIAKQEPIPDKPLNLPQIAPQLVDRIYFEKFNPKNPETAKYITTIDGNLQRQVNRILERHSEQWKANGIQNGAALILEVASGKVLTYAGNIPSSDMKQNNNSVDVIKAPRSPGSTLKPLLFSAMLSDGLILPTSLIPDIPTQIAGYAPKNFNMDYDGAVSANRAISRSLNVPAIRMLRNYGLERFHLMLQRMGMSTINKPADHYGLSLILGGGETSLWELCGIYASMARILNQYHKNSSRYDARDWHMPYILNDEIPVRKPKELMELDETFMLGAAAIYATFEAMEEVMRPGEEAIFKELNVSHKIAWKTGTSYGYRDGWAIGCTPKYVVGVWVGNADGEGRPGLTGIATAAPALFEIFSLLPSGAWFDMPYDDMTKVAICASSGYRASTICDKTDSIWVPNAGLRSGPCPYHQMIHLDASAKTRVHSDCESPDKMIHTSWFVLPPAMEWYYKSKNLNYKVLPPYRADCEQNNPDQQDMEIIYPKSQSQIYVPIEIDGSPGRTVFEIAHRVPSTIVYWHMDDTYLGFTKSFHQMALFPPPGKHLLSLVDENGSRIEMSFEIVNKKQ